MARSPKTPSDSNSKPKVHVTATGGRYVEAGELLRNAEARKAINSMAQLSADDSNRGTKDTSSEG